MARSSHKGVWGCVYDRLQERRSFATPGDLARYLNPRLIDTPALELIDEKLVHLVRSHDGRLIISVPPQEGKSERGVYIWFHDKEEAELTRTETYQQVVERYKKRFES